MHGTNPYAPTALALTPPASAPPIFALPLHATFPCAPTALT